ncbi:MAG: hypothetical protein CMJ69_15995 [Planctomycetaceae bacterium]|nr:hypothetical protein [Planctomycetaceae bacterium]
MTQASSDSVNRRDFARTIAAATAATAATSLEPASADDKPKKPSKPKAPPEPPPPAALLLETIRQRYPDKQLDDREVLQGIYSELRSDLARSRRLSGFPLKNSDEPGFIFSAFPASD